MIPGAVLTTDGQGIACLVPMPDRCAARARIVRDHADRLELGQGTTDLDILARRIAWDAHAAGEYPRPMLSDGVDLSAAWPELSEIVWHLIAGAAILGPGCDCQPPAGHRDALVEVAVMVAAHQLRTIAREYVPSDRDPWCTDVTTVVPA